MTSGPVLRATRHWIVRCQDRGVPGDHVRLFEELRQAILDGRDDLVRYIGKVRGGNRAYRFWVGDQEFVAICSRASGTPLTVYSEGMSLTRRKPSRRARVRRA